MSEQKDVVVAPVSLVAEKKYVNIVEMLADVKPTFKKLLLSAKPELQFALERIDPTNISPRVSDILEFARYVELSDIRACIIGQDPYPDVNHAHGLCFSTRNPKLPGSLKNVYECLQLHGFIPKGAPLPSGLLTSWAAAGVLMINMALTTEIGKSNAHKDIWKPYMKKILAAIGALDQPIVYFLWGKDAQAMESSLKNNGKSLILKAVHPSPQSQAGLQESEQFRHYTHFADANSFLIKHDCGQVDWNPANNHVVYVSCGHFEQANKHLQDNSKGALEWNPDATHVVYTDGSASGNGIDKKIRDEFEKAEKPPPTDAEILSISTERGTMARGGYGAYFTAGPLKSLTLTGRFGPVHSETSDEIIFPSNIRGEGLAIIHSLEHVYRCRAPRVVEVVTDSEFWIDMVEKYIPKWISIASPFTAHKNPDLVARLWDVVCKIRAVGSVKFRHVRSHGKDKNIAPVDKLYNARADQLATTARNADHFFEAVSRS